VGSGPSRKALRASEWGENRREILFARNAKRGRGLFAKGAERRILRFADFAQNDGFFVGRCADSDRLPWPPQTGQQAQNDGFFSVGWQD
jgi:hypothetical protein